MSVLIRYNPSGLTREQYDKVTEFFMSRAAETGPPPQTLQVHVFFGDGDDLQISEVWESEDAWREQYDGLLGEALDYAHIQRDPQVLAIQDFWGVNVPAPPAPPA